MNKYKIIFDDEYKDEDTAKIRILDGKYKDLVYHYNYVSFNEESVNLQFEYDIDETPEGLEVDKLKSEDRKEFETVLGDILVDIVESKNENRTDNTDKPAL
jgi:hypothetical protein